MGLMQLAQRVFGRSTPTRVGEGAETDPWFLRDGSQVYTPWEEALVAEGRVFIANGGTGTSPITFGAGTIDTTEPDFDLLLPVGSSVEVIPLSVLIHLEAFGTDAIFEGMVSFGLGGTQGTDTDVEPANMRTDRPLGSVCTVGVASNADAVYMTQNVGEINRFGIQKVATTATGDDDSNRVGETYLWRRGASSPGPRLRAEGLAARLNVFAAAQASTGFIQVCWAEVPYK